MLDSRDRRIRTYPPQPHGKWIEIIPSDYDVWQNNWEFGDCLPIHYLFAFSGKKNYPTFQNRATRYFNGFCSCYRNHIIDREGIDLCKKAFPDEKHIFTTFMWRDARFNDRSQEIKTQPIIYSNTEHTNQLLAKDGRLSPHVWNNDHQIHRLMRGTTGASIKLACLARKWGYISQTDILSDDRARSKTLKLPLVDRTEANYLVTDGIFGIHADKKKHFFVHETDRGTEQVSYSPSLRNTIYQKISGFLDVLANRTYHEVWGLPNLKVLFITTGKGRVESMRKLTLQLAAERGKPQLAELFRYRACPEFYPPWIVPPIYTHILDDLL